MCALEIMDRPFTTFLLSSKHKVLVLKPLNNCLPLGTISGLVCLRTGVRGVAVRGGGGVVQQPQASAHPSVSTLHAVKLPREGQSDFRMIMDLPAAEGPGVKVPIFTPVANSAINLARKAMGSHSQVTLR